MTLSQSDFRYRWLYTAWSPDDTGNTAAISPPISMVKLKPSLGYPAFTSETGCTAAPRSYLRQITLRHPKIVLFSSCCGERHKENNGLSVTFERNSQSVTGFDQNTLLQCYQELLFWKRKIYFIISNKHSRISYFVYYFNNSTFVCSCINTSTCTDLQIQVQMVFLLIRFLHVTLQIVMMVTLWRNL